MSITISLRQPIGMSERGKRANNEDSIFPLQAHPQDSLFIVCDGVGGAAKGNIASRLVCDTFAKIFTDVQISEPDTIGMALKEVEQAVQNYTRANPESTGMATTLTLLHFHDNGATVAHVGDSRIYQIRNGEILYRSEDHSFVQELVRSGIITPEQAASHPKRNVITRAIQGKENPTKADVYVLQDIQADDYFFLCSDGILESVNDGTLREILTSSDNNEEKIDTIKILCEARSRDNFSCYLIQIEAAEGTADIEANQPPMRIAPAKTQPAPEPKTQSFAPPSNEGYRPDAVTVITPMQASKPQETPANPYRSDAVTVITPMQASKPAEKLTGDTQAQSNSDSKEASSSKFTYLLFAIVIVVLIAGAIWWVLNQEMY
jgi:PPM family protein phosphatase